MSDCKVCHTPELEYLIERDNCPLTSVDVARKGSPPAPVGKMVLGMCMHCGIIQLMEPDQSLITYGEDYTSSNYQRPAGEVDEKLQRLLNFIEGTGVGPGAKVLEIGCYDGSLMNTMVGKFGYNVYGCDPCGPAQELAKWNNKVVPALFNPDSYIGHKFDMVVFRNVLEHLPSPLAFLTQVGQVLNPMGKIVLEVPDGEFRVCNGILGSIVPQHASYFGPDTLKSLLHHAGFGEVIVEARRGGLLGRAMKGAKQRSVLNDLEAIYKCAVAGTRWNIQKAQEVRKKLEKTEGDIWLYGANTCTTELLVADAVPKERIAGVIDDDSLKWGRVMVNTDIEVFPRAIVENIHGIVVVCSYYSHNVLYRYLTDTLSIGSRVLRLYPNVVLRKVI